MDVPNASGSTIFSYLQDKFEELKANGTVIMPTHKRNAILVTLSKLPGATGKSFSSSNVQKGFVLNGQIDSESKLAPDAVNVLHTYRGDTQGTCLENPAKLIEYFYEEMYTTGIVSEESFNLYSIPEDRNLEGEIVPKNHGISQENRQRAKILSSPSQIEERRKLVYEKRKTSYKKQKQLYDTESDEYDRNRSCTMKIFDIMANHKISTGVIEEDQVSSFTFMEMCSNITVDILTQNKKYILNAEAKSFIRVRSEVSLVRGRLTYKNIPDRKEDVLKRLVQIIGKPIRSRFFVTKPVAPILQMSIVNDNVHVVGESARGDDGDVEGNDGMDV